MKSDKLKAGSQQIGIRMALYLDSAIIAEAQAVRHWGWVNGVMINLHQGLIANTNHTREMLQRSIRN